MGDLNCFYGEGQEGFKHHVFLPSGEEDIGEINIQSASIKKRIKCRYCEFVTSTIHDLNSHINMVHTKWVNDRSQPHAKRPRVDDDQETQFSHPSDAPY